MTELKMGRKKGINAETLKKSPTILTCQWDILLVKNNKKNAPALNKRDERDIAKKLDGMLGQLGSSEEALMFDGQPLDEETRELPRASLKNQLEITKKKLRKKYIPKKYRK